jgi:hypothetical protein
MISTIDAAPKVNGCAPPIALEGPLEQDNERGRTLSSSLLVKERSAEEPAGKSVCARIRERLPELTALEARVVSAIISQRSIGSQTLLKVVAAEARISQAMVIKIAKKLGFDGFRSLRAA